MAPNRTRPTEDSRSESSTTTTKNPGGAPAPSSQPVPTKGKRAANNGAVNGGSNLKDVTSAADSAAVGGGGGAGAGDAGENAYGGINWTTVDPAVLNAYRHARKLEIPTAFADLVNQTLLMHPRGVGRFSPTMARHRPRRRVPREQLAMAVRKDFNAAAVNETEVVTSFLYSVKNQHKHFRMRFGPGPKGGVTKRAE